jgi:hypothetical protein
MELADLLLELRQNRLDDTAVPPLWGDGELVSALNDAVRQVCIRQRCLVESESVQLCTISVAAGQRVVRLHPAVIAVRSAWIPGCCEALVGIPEQRLTRTCPGWIDRDPGVPRWWIPDYQEGCIALHPTPEAATTLRLSVWRMPLEDEELDANDPSAEPAIATHWHMDLVDWAEYRAFSKKDAETIDTDRARTAAQVFTAKVGRLPAAHEIRLWGVSPITGVPAEFL